MEDLMLLMGGLTFLNIVMIGICTFIQQEEHKVLNEKINRIGLLLEANLSEEDLV